MGICFAQIEINAPLGTVIDGREAEVRHLRDLTSELKNSENRLSVCRICWWALIRSQSTRLHGKQQKSASAPEKKKVQNSRLELGTAPLPRPLVQET